MNTKMCRKCGEIKSTTEFYKSMGKKDGLHSYCKRCAKNGASKAYRKLNQKSWMIDQANNARTAAIRIGDNIKTKYNCVICGESCPFCLEFHHVDANTKLKEVSTLLRAKKVKDAIIEANKCVVLCCNCHSKVHAGISTFDINQQCNEDLNYWLQEYTQYKKETLGQTN